MLSGLGVDSDANKKEEASNVFTLLTSLAEMKRFELLRRFEPTYRISSVSGISEPGGI